MRRDATESRLACTPEHDCVDRSQDEGPEGDEEHVADTITLRIAVVVVMAVETAD